MPDTGQSRGMSPLKELLLRCTYDRLKAALDSHLGQNVGDVIPGSGSRDSHSFRDLFRGETFGQETQRLHLSRREWCPRPVSTAAAGGERVVVRLHCFAFFAAAMRNRSRATLLLEPPAQGGVAK